MAGLGDEIPAWARRCPSGKQKFASAEDCRAAAKSLKRGKAAAMPHGTIHPYRCELCDAYHFTSTARRHNKKPFNRPPS